MTPGLKYAVLCNGFVFQKWQAEAIRHLRDKGHELLLLVVDSRKPIQKSFWNRLKSYPWKNLFFRLFTRYLVNSNAKSPVSMEEELRGLPVITCQVEQRNTSEYFLQKDIDAIRSYHLDFILRFGFNIIRGHILDAARYGVWSFHHDDEMKYRGGPPAFWEIYYHDPVTGAILQRLTNKLDAGIILKKGYLKTQAHSYRANLDQMLDISATWPMLVAEEIKNGKTHFLPPSKSSAAIFKLPGNFTMLKFFLIRMWNYFKFQYRDLFLAEHWNVGVVNRSVEELALDKAPLKNDSVVWYPRVPSGHYLADPYGFIEDRRIHILLEDYNYFQGRANIAEVIYNPVTRSFSMPLSAIESGKHLSYPFIIVHDQDNVFCIPESFRNRTIELYKRNFSEGSFVEERVLVRDIDAVDPTLFHYEKHWWLFFTLRSTSNTHLYIYYASDLKGPYVPHLMNPVKIDITSSRPGGTPFFYQGHLYRPAQDCSESYGRRVVVNRIMKLTPDEFEEVTANIIDPPAKGTYSKGLHTLSGVGGYTLIDGKKYQFSRQHFFRQLKKKFHRHWGKHA